MIVYIVIKIVFNVTLSIIYYYYCLKNSKAFHVLRQSRETIGFVIEGTPEEGPAFCLLGQYKHGTRSVYTSEHRPTVYSLEGRTLVDRII